MEAVPARNVSTKFTISFARGLFDLQITFMMPFPGTPLCARLRNEGRILEEEAWGRYSWFESKRVARVARVASSGLTSR